MKKEYWYVLLAVAAIALFYYWKMNHSTAALGNVLQAPVASFSRYTQWASERGQMPTASGFENYKAGVKSGSVAFLGNGGM